MAGSSVKFDFKKYAGAEFIDSIVRVVNLFGDCIKELVIPPAVLVGLTLLLSAYIPFTNSFSYFLFLAVGLIGGTLTGLSFGMLKVVESVSNDINKVFDQVLLLIQNIVDDIYNYANDVSSLPPVSDIIQGVIGSVILPVISGVIRSKFYGRFLMVIFDPILRNAGEFLGRYMKKFISTTTHSIQNNTSQNWQQQHDRKGGIYEDYLMNKRGDVLRKKKQVDEVLQRARERVPGVVDTVATKLYSPLRVTTFLSCVITVVSMVGIYQSS